MSKETAKQTGPVILTFDTETTPIITYTWDLYPDRLSHENIVQEWSFISAAWKELGKDKVHSVQISKVGDDKKLVKALRDVLEKADIIVGQNIVRFDIKKLNARLIYHNLPPLPKLVVVDTLQEAKKIAKFTSNRLDYLGKHLLGEGKMEVHYQLWLDVMKGSKPALKKMVSYNKVDVIRNEAVYLKLRPYMHKHPHVSVLEQGEKHDCPKCGSIKVKKSKVRVLASGTKQQQWQCQDCGGYHTTTFKQSK